MWTRNDTRPTRYRGILFRSGLEAKVAAELDDLGVSEWEYELPWSKTVKLPHGGTLEYLPDFTFLAPRQYPELALPQWLEVKPPEALYALRDHASLPERFEGEHSVALTARELREVGVEEVWKPKALAELSGLAVLVVSAINRNRTLSVLMAPDAVLLSRSHPLVNHRQVVLDRQRAERETQWQAEWERRQAAAEAERRAWERDVIAYARAHSRRARFDDWCVICRREVPAARLVIFRAADGRWAALCGEHLTADGPQPAEG